MVPTTNDTDESDLTDKGPEAVVKNDRISILTSEAITEVSGNLVLNLISRIKQWDVMIDSCARLI